MWTRNHKFRRMRSELCVYGPSAIDRVQTHGHTRIAESIAFESHSFQVSMSSSHPGFSQCPYCSLWLPSGSELLHLAQHPGYVQAFMGVGAACSNAAHAFRVPLLQRKKKRKSRFDEARRSQVLTVWRRKASLTPSCTCVAVVKLACLLIFSRREWCGRWGDAVVIRASQRSAQRLGRRSRRRMEATRSPARVVRDAM